jgi:hypothetical protein
MERERKMRRIGVLFRLSYQVEPPPDIETLLLEEICDAQGEALLVVTRDLGALSPGSLVALTADDEDFGRLLATARFKNFLPVSSAEWQQLRRAHPLYRDQTPSDPAGFLVLTDVQRRSDLPPIDVLQAWTADGGRLTADSLPIGRDGVSTWVVQGGEAPSSEEAAALLRAARREQAHKEGRLRAALAQSSRMAEEMVSLAERLRAEANQRERSTARLSRFGGQKLLPLMTGAFPDLEFCEGTLDAVANLHPGALKKLGRYLQVLGTAGIAVQAPEEAHRCNGAEGWWIWHLGSGDRLYWREGESDARRLVFVEAKADQAGIDRRLRSLSRRHGPG